MSIYMNAITLSEKENSYLYNLFKKIISYISLARLMSKILHIKILIGLQFFFNYFYQARDLSLS
jgi:hypothetical protein